jgi:hypothetical protein
MFAAVDRVLERVGSAKAAIAGACGFALFEACESAVGTTATPISATTVIGAPGINDSGRARFCCRQKRDGSCH